VGLQCGIQKKVSIHSLRHSFATRLLEHGLSLRHIQSLLGDASPTTTALYTQLTDRAEQDAARTIHQLVSSLHVELRTIGS
jgi:integrase/recombinase XerD